MSNNTIFTASIVTYHTDPDEIRRCIETLKELGVTMIYVVDNGNEGERVGRICDEYGSYALYVANDNTGYGAGHNIAMCMAAEINSEYHLVVNTDLEISPTSFGELMGYMEGHADVAMVHPRILNCDGSDQYTIRRLPTPLDLIARRFLPNWMLKRRRARYILKNFDHSRALNVPYVQGSCMLMRMSCLKATGLFDERFFMYAEDIDLSRRLHEQYKTMYVPEATAIHYHNAASYRSSRMLRIHVANMIRYFNKWGWFYDRSRRAMNLALDRRIAHSAPQTLQSPLT